MSDQDDMDRWSARFVALEGLYGPCDPPVAHRVVGFDLRGGVDLFYFRHHVNGILAVTAELTGRDEQIRNRLGTYEIALCTRHDEAWVFPVLGRLAAFSLEAELEPRQTLEADPPLWPEDSSLCAALFFDYGRIKVQGEAAGVLLCVGITAGELELCREGRAADVVRALKRAHVFPFTDATRKSVVSGRPDLN